MKNLNPCKHFIKEEHGRWWKKSSTRGRVLQTSMASEGETIDFQIGMTKQSVKCKGLITTNAPSKLKLHYRKNSRLSTMKWDNRILLMGFVQGNPSNLRVFMWWLLLFFVEWWWWQEELWCKLWWWRWLMNGLVANSKSFLLLIVLYCKLTANSLSWFIMILCLMLLLFFRVGPESRYLNLIWLTIMGWVFKWDGLCYLC